MTKRKLLVVSIVLAALFLLFILTYSELGTFPTDDIFIQFFRNFTRNWLFIQI